MTSAKTCHASNTTQDLEKATRRPVATTEAFKIAMFQCSIVVIWKNWISSWNLKYRFSTIIVACSFVANFVSYISAKYYLNWFSFHIVVMKVIGVNFFWNTVYLVKLYLVRPHLEYCSSAWSPYCQKQTFIGESWISVQNYDDTRYKKNLQYEEQWKKPGIYIWSLEERKNRADLLGVFKMKNGS